MKKIYFLLFVLISTYSFSQKNYRIENCIWEFKQPTNYIVRIDNFEQAIKAGKEYLEKDEIMSNSLDDKILFSIAKSENSPINMIISNYQGNENIKNFTLKGYAKD